MQTLLKTIKSEIKTSITAGEAPQAVYERVCEKYCENEKYRRFLKRFIARRVKNSVTPENRRKFRFLYYCYLISLWIAFLITLISKQNRIDALGIGSLSDVSLWGTFVVFNLFAWLYLYLAVRSMRFNLGMAYWALFVATVDAVRLLILLPVYWNETPFFAVLRLVPPLLTLLFGVFYVVKCRNYMSK